jgi:hypothetical protein
VELRGFEPLTSSMPSRSRTLRRSRAVVTGVHRRSSRSRLVQRWCPPNCPPDTRDQVYEEGCNQLTEGVESGLGITSREWAVPAPGGPLPTTLRQLPAFHPSTVAAAVTPARGLGDGQACRRDEMPTILTFAHDLLAPGGGPRWRVSHPQAITGSPATVRYTDLRTLPGADWSACGREDGDEC